MDCVHNDGSDNTGHHVVQNTRQMGSTCVNASTATCKKKIPAANNGQVRPYGPKAGSQPETVALRIGDGHLSFKMLSPPWAGTAKETTERTSL